MKILVKELIGSRCILKDDGQKIFSIISPLLTDDEQVTLDFTEVTLFASPFFNFSIGQLISIITEERLKSNLHIENLDPIGRNVMGKVIENATKFHNNKNYKEIVDQILERQAREAE